MEVMDENTLNVFKDFCTRHIEDDDELQEYLSNSDDMLNFAILGYKLGSLVSIKDEIIKRYKEISHIVKKNDVDLKSLNPIDIIKLRRFLELVKVDFKTYDDGILRFDGIFF